MAEEEFTDFDENKAVEYINNALLNKGKQQYSDDDLLLLIDAMYDYYDENDDFESDVDIEEDIDGIVKYVEKAVAKDSLNKIQKEDIRDIVIAEMEYEETLG